MEERKARSRSAAPDVSGSLDRIESLISSVLKGQAELTRRVTDLEQDAGSTLLRTQRAREENGRAQAQVVHAAEAVPRMEITPAMEREAELKMHGQRDPSAIQQVANEQRVFKRYMEDPRTPKRMIRVRKGEEHEAIVMGCRVIYDAGRYVVPELLAEVYEDWLDRMQDVSEHQKKFLMTDDSGGINLRHVQGAVDRIDKQSARDEAVGMERLLAEMDREPEPWESSR
jgi:hypothetical protein